MHTLRPGFYIIAILLNISFCGFSQPADSLYKSSLSFGKLDSFQVAGYSPPEAKKGRAGNDRLVIRILGEAARGKDGHNGRPGPALLVKVATALISDSVALQVTIMVNDKHKRTDTYYVNPRYGKLSIITDGGDGGEGGRGEDGADASSGGHVAKSGAAGGTGGRGGDGGTIKVIIDSSAIAYSNCSCLIYSNRAGNPGMGGTGGRAGAPGDYHHRADNGGDGNSGEGGKQGPPVEIRMPDGKITMLKQSS